MLLLLQNCVIVLVASCLVSAQTYPTTVELDLVFPQNDTYASADLFPVVFAFRNPPAWPLLLPNIRWKIQRPHADDTLDGGFVDLSGFYINTTVDPFYYAAGSWALSNATIEGPFVLGWYLEYLTCSHGEVAGMNFTSPSDGSASDKVWFTVDKGGRAPDAQALAGGGACPATPGSVVALNVTGMLQLIYGDPTFQNNGSICPDVRTATPMGTAMASPCGPTVGSSAASSIASSLTAEACYPSKNQGYAGTCPPPPTPTASSLAASIARLSWDMWCGLWLAGIVAMVMGFAC